MERAQPKGDAGIARPWSKHSEGSSRAQKLAKAKVKKSDGTKLKESPQTAASPAKAASSMQGDGGSRGDVEKEEFMAALKKRSEARFWDNDDAALDQSQALSDRGDESDEGSEAEAAGDAHIIEEEKEGNEPSKGGDKRRSKPGVSDMDWLRSKVGNSEGVIDEASGSEGEVVDSNEQRADNRGAGQGGNSGKGRQGRLEDAASSEGNHANASIQDPVDPSNGENDEVESGLSVGRLFVRNLPYSTTDDDLRELFGAYGVLSDVHLPVDDVNKVRRRVAFGSVGEECTVCWPLLALTP